MSLDLAAEQLQGCIDDCDDEIASIEQILERDITDLRAAASVSVAEQQRERARAVAALQVLAGQAAHGNATDPAPSPIVGGDAHPSPPARTFGPPRKYDYAEVAAFIRHCIAERWAVLPSLQAQYSTTPGMAKHLLKTARKFDPTLPALPRGGPAGRGPRVAGRNCPPVAAPKPSNRVGKPEIVKVDKPKGVQRDDWKLIPDKPASPLPSFVDLDVVDTTQPPESKGLTYQVVADAYLEAEDSVRMPLSSLADRFGVPRTWVGGWVRECRARGLLPSRDQAQRDRVAEVGRRATPNVKVGNW